MKRKAFHIISGSNHSIFEPSHLHQSTTPPQLPHHLPHVSNEYLCTLLRCPCPSSSVTSPSPRHPSPPPLPLSCFLPQSYHPPNAELCDETLVVVEEIDHFCPWTGTTIAKRNLKCFYTFLMCICLQVRRSCGLHNT